MFARVTVVIFLHVAELTLRFQRFFLIPVCSKIKPHKWQDVTFGGFAECAALCFIGFVVLVQRYSSTIAQRPMHMDCIVSSPYQLDKQKTLAHRASVLACPHSHHRHIPEM